MFARKLLTSALLAVAFATPAAAQFVTSGAAPAGMTPPDPQALYSMFCNNLSADTESQISYLNTKLGITTDEQSAFNTYAAALRSAIVPVQTYCASRPATMPTTYPDRVTDGLNFEAAQYQADQIRVPAGKTFYNALTSAQQKILDQGGIAQIRMGIGG